MKKLFVMGVLAAFCAPVFAADNHDAAFSADKHQAPRQEMRKDRDGKREMRPEMKAKMEEAKAQRKARKAKFKQNEEKLEKLVKEYKSAKEGSKKQLAAREEIGKVLQEVRVEQIAFRSEELKGLEKRLEDMKFRLSEEQKPEAVNAWVDKMTDKVIVEDGDLEDALESESRIRRAPRPEGPRPPEPPAPAFEPVPAN